MSIKYIFLQIFNEIVGQFTLNIRSVDYKGATAPKS